MFRPGLVLLLGATLAARAEVKLHGLFSDHMVLQRGAPVPVWGWADDGETVIVEFGHQKVKTVAAGGQWMVRLKKLRASAEPAELKVSGKNNAITLHDVLVGEVWIASGQSNMEWPIRATFDADNEVSRTANSLLRLHTVPKLRANVPTNNVPSAWQECNPQNSPGFSAVAYYFGRDLQRALDVPVGMIHTSWGGSPAEVWMSQDVLEKNPRYKSEILDVYPASQKRYEEALTKFQDEEAAAKKENRKPTLNRPWQAWKPTELYNGMIAPLLPYAIKGAIWYQGESNAGRAEQYRSLMADLIRNWRQDWGSKLTFLQVQLAPFTAIKDAPGDSTWAELREAQNLAAKNVGKAGVAVITDVGEEKDIHPKKKAPVGARLALLARRITYGESLVYSGPTFRSQKVKGDHIVLNFDNVGGGLQARDGELKGFAIAGLDQRFQWAKAEIRGDQIVVSSPQVAKPAVVRYGWADYPVVNLWNADGLPASPFRTDDFPMVTAGKK